MDFPIQGKLIKSIPWAMIAPHEERALRNHDQTLKRLAERGGLSAKEAMDVLDNQPWSGTTFVLPRDRIIRDAQYAKWEQELINRVRLWKQP